MNIKKYILEQKEKLNIDIIKFSKGNTSEFLIERLQERIDENKITEFENTDIVIKTDVNKTLENYKTIIVIGQSYINDYKKKNKFNRGLLTKSSWGEDYHHVLKRKMEDLIEIIKNKYGGQYKSFVDTGPLVDRNLAYTSGIGYYGKNCSIINKKYGSYIVIGYIITDLEIELDDIKLLNSECGECKLCIEYCPTKAIESPYKLNPKKCISYLTQTKEKIPYEYREKMGTRIYGCDICQDICPKNKNILKPNHIEFLPIETDGAVDIDEILTMSNRQFKEKYGNMSGSWRGKNILKRNAIIAIGNKKDKNYKDILLKELDNDNILFSEYALWSLVKIYKENSELILGDKLKNKPNLKNEYNKIKSFFDI